MKSVAIVVAGLSALWTLGALDYRYMFRRWLRLRYWPLALGLCLKAQRVPEWERPSPSTSREARK